MALIQLKCIDPANCQLLTKNKVYVGKLLTQTYVVYNDLGVKGTYEPRQFEIVGKR